MRPPIAWPGRIPRDFSRRVDAVTSIPALVIGPLSSICRRSPPYAIPIPRSSPGRPRRHGRGQVSRQDPAEDLLAADVGVDWVALEPVEALPRFPDVAPPPGRHIQEARVLRVGQ